MHISKLKVWMASMAILFCGLNFAAHPALAASLPDSKIPGIKHSSNNWSGYVATGGMYTSVSGSWTVPKVVSNGSVAADAAWVGIGGVGHEYSDLIQAGTATTSDDRGGIVYEAWIEMLPDLSQTIPLAVRAGDSMTVNLTLQSGNDWKIMVKNNTTGKDYQTTVQYDSSVSSAEWVQEAPSTNERQQMTLSDFGSVQFTDGYTVKDGNKVSIAESGAEMVTMINSSRQVIASPSKIGSDGASFIVERVKASTTATSPEQVPQVGDGSSVGDGASGIPPMPEQMPQGPHRIPQRSRIPQRRPRTPSNVLPGTTATRSPFSFQN